MTAVVLDATVLAGQSGRSGLGHFVRGLLDGLRVVDGLDVTAVAPRGTELAEGIGWAPARARLPGRLEMVSHDVLLPRELARAAGDVVHVPAGVPPRRVDRPLVQNLHDLISLTSTDPALAFTRRFWRRRSARWRRADVVVSGSRYSADRAIEVLDLDPARVLVIPHGVDRSFTPHGPSAADGRPYLLSVGELSPRKGFERAVAALDALADAGLPHELRLVGNVAPHAGALLEQTLRAARHPERIRHLGYVEDLSAQYRGATLYLGTSRAEGFGLPVAEAMACGCPVVAFANTAVSEVVGDGGELVPDGDVAALADAARRLASDPALHEERAALARRRGEQFRWSTAARAYAEVYRQVATA